MNENEIYTLLIRTGRKLVEENGAEFLTARKLSEASKCSVGTIYNRFSNMDNFIIAQNLVTLDELLYILRKVQRDNDSYKNLNRYVDAFSGYVLSHANLWFLLYNFHLNNPQKLPQEYSRKLVEITSFINREFYYVFDNLSTKTRKLSLQVLWLSLFSMSSFLSADSLQGFSRFNKKTVCKLLLNTYLAGMTVIKG